MIKNLLNVLLIIAEYFLDYLRQIRWSKASPLSPKVRSIYYDIILLAHTVEKGLSVPEPRPNFGQQKIRELISCLDRYGFKNVDLFPIEKSYGCLSEYMMFHQAIGVETGELGKIINVFLTNCEQHKIKKKGGTKSINNALLEPSPEVQDFLLSRFSCRNFEDSIVKSSTLKKLADIVVRTPSQCNRQSAKLHYYSDPEIIDSLLRLQGGAEGFRANVRNLFVVSSDLTAWSGLKARSQAYVDGSLLAMQTLNACQSLGLGCCPLNLAVTNKKELDICAAGNISTGERLIMMIAFGYPKQVQLKVARSERVDISNVMVKH